MTAVALLARVQLRRGWRGLVAVGLLAGFVGAVVVGALAGARRTDTAFDRLAQASSVPDAFVVPMGEAPEAFAEILALPEVESGWKWRMSVGRLVETHDWAAVQSTDDMPDDGYQPLLVRGRLPLPHPPTRWCSPRTPPNRRAPTWATPCRGPGGRPSRWRRSTNGPSRPRPAPGSTSAWWGS